MKLISSKYFFTQIAIAFLLTNASFANSASELKKNAEETLKNIPTSFRKNMGQWDSEILYQGSSPGWDANVYFLKNGLSFGFKRPINSLKEDSYENIEYMVWNQYFKNSSANVSIEAAGQQDSHTNYFLGSDKNHHRVNVPDYSIVMYKNIYNNIDISYYSTGAELKYDYLIGKGGNIDDIEVSLEGVKKISLNKKGQLEIYTSWGVLIDELPESYQLISGQKKNCNIEYRIIDNTTYGFEIKGEYDINEELIIDPVNLLWSTFVGGTASSGNGYLRDMAIDANGNVYATGWYTNSFPVTPGAYNINWSGTAGLAITGGDVFVFKLDPSGSNLIFATYIGGANNEEGLGIDVANSGDIYVTGITKSSGFPTSTGAYSVTYNGPTNSNEAFFLKLDNSGSTLQYSTFLGGTASYDQGNSIAVASNGDAIITGKTSSSNFPITPGAFQQFIAGSSDGFVAKIAPNGAGNADLISSTFIGGSGPENSTDVVLNSLGEIFICGSASSANFPVTAGCFSNIQSGSSDAFVVKLNNSCSTVLYSTFIGGTLSDVANAIDVNAAGEIFITGYAGSSDFPVTTGAYDVSYNGGSIANLVKTDVFVSKISPSGNGTNDLKYSTYVGGSANDYGSDLAVNSNDEVFVSGYTASNDFPVTSCAYDPTNNTIATSNGLFDLFLIKLNATGSILQYGTYIGGSDADYGDPKIKLFGTCDEQLYFGTTSHSVDFPTTPGVFQPLKLNTSWDQPAVFTFKAEINMGFTHSPVNQTCNGITIGFTDTSNASCVWDNASWRASNWQWDFGDGTTSNLQNPQHLYTSSGTYQVKLKISCPEDEITIPVNIILPQQLSAYVPTQNNVTCFGGNDGNATAATLGGTAPYQYNWSTVPAQNTIIATGLSAGTYTVVITDRYGCTASQTTQIIEPSQVTIPPLTNFTTCAGQPVTLTATANGGNGNYSFTWSPGGTISSTLSVTTNITTTYSVVATDINGCISPVQTVTVFIGVNPIIIYSTPVAPVCQGSNAILTAWANGGNGNYTFTWLPGNINGSSIIVSPNATTTYTVIATDICNDPVSTTVSVEVNQLPAISITADQTAGCPTLCINFYSGNNPSIVSNHWGFGDGTQSSTVGLINHCYDTPGIYSVSLTITDANGCTNSIVKDNWIVVHPVPTAAFSAGPQPTTILNPLISFTNQSGGHSLSEWNFGDLENSSSTIENPSFNYPDSGRYEVTLIVTNEFGCTSSATDYIIIKTDFTFYAPNTFTPNGDGLNETFKPVQTGVDENNYELFIFDRWGNLIFKTNDYNKGWNGCVNGSNKVAQIDTYVWKVRFFDIYGNRHQLLGHVNLLK